MTPFSLFRRMADEFDRALQPLASEGEINQAIAWTPTVEISERDGKFNILAELPGLSPNEVRVEAEDDALVIQGERKMERESTEGGVRRSERQFGFFYRRIPLPEGADPEQAKARFHDGVLEISMPAPKPQSNRRQIQIESDSKSSSTETKPAANDAKQRRKGKVTGIQPGDPSRLVLPGHRPGSNVATSKDVWPVALTSRPSPIPLP